MKVEIDPDDLVSGRTDDRGRLTLGAAYANQDVTVLIEVQE